MKKVWTIALLATLLLSGCSGISEIDIREVKLVNAKFVNTSSADLEFLCVVHNPTNRRIIIEDANGVLKKGDIVFARIYMVKADTIASNGLSSNKVLLNVSVEDPLSLLSMGMNFRSWDMSEFKGDVRSTIRREGRAKHVFKRKNIPLEGFLERL